MMKRISAAIFVMFLAAMSLNASTVKSDRVGFTVNEVSVAGGFYNDDYKNCPVIMASYLLGRHFNERLFAGVSAACTFSTYYDGYWEKGERVYGSDFGIRLFLNGRYFFMRKSFSPYVGLDLGGATIPTHRGFLSPYAGCQLGVRYLMKTHKIIGFCIEPGISTKGYSEILFKLSFEFN